MKFINMIAAVLAAGAAFGACEYVAKDTAWVYKWKFTGKTTYGAKPSKVKSTANLCGYNGKSAATCVVRCPASLKIEGYTWICSPGCGSDSFETISEVNEVFWQKKPVKAAFSGGVATEICNIIGKKADKCEIGGNATFKEFCNGAAPGGLYKFTYAGLGKYDKRNNRVKSASGNFAGNVIEPVVIDGCDPIPMGFWECGTLNSVCDNCIPTVIYGKWSVKYQKSASKKYLRNGRIPKYPAWARNLNAE